jgi:ATP/maltotriose-dependent transcriptional regulator MalT
MTNEANPILLEKVAAQIQQALVLAEQGDLIGSEALYHEVLEQKPEHPLALYGLAQLAGAIDDLEVKEALLSQAIEQLIDKPSPEQKSLVASWLTELSEVLFKLNRPTDAMYCLRQCESLIVENLKAPPAS